MTQTSNSVPKGLLAGMIGGAVGTLVLNLFQTASLKGTEAAEKQIGNGKKYTKEQQALLKGYEKAHAITAVQAAGVVGRKLSGKQRRKSPPLVEYAFGTLCGGIYGALAEVIPEVTTGAGTVYGATLFTGASEILIPALGWIDPPTSRTPVQHLGGLAGNIVYGATTEFVRRLLRDLLP